MTDTDETLRVDGLQTQFRLRGGHVHAVRDVSFVVRRSEKVGIVGESGSGKSALALSLLRLIEPPGEVLAGGVWLNGRDVTLLAEREMESVRGKEIAMIFQDPMSALDPVKTIGSQIVEALRHHQAMSQRAARRQAAELLKEVELPRAAERLDDYPHQYSGGMRQRVMIAIALANSPDVLIADEPTTALDVTTQAQVFRLLDRLVADHGTAVVLITHNFGLVAEFCDTVNVMYAGRFVEQGPVQQVFRFPTHPYTDALLRSVPRPDRLTRGKLFSIPGFPPSLVSLPSGCSFEPRCPVGHGKTVCREEAPPRRALQLDGHLVVSECHFAPDWRNEGAVGSEAT